jgi:hypothetical protein
LDKTGHNNRSKTFVDAGTADHLSIAFAMKQADNLDTLDSNRIEVEGIDVGKTKPRLRNNKPEEDGNAS